MVLRMILAEDFESLSNHFGASLFPSGQLELAENPEAFCKALLVWFSSLFGEWPGGVAGIWLIRLVEIRGSLKGSGVLIENASYRIAVG